MRIMIIGCGYVGTEIAKLWKQKNHIVTATARRPIKCESLKEVVDHVILLDQMEKQLPSQEAVLLSMAAGDRNHYKEAYLDNAKRVLNAILHQTYLLYTGSTSVYGDQQGSWVDEESPLKPQTPQAEILCQTEAVIRNHKRHAIFRLGEIYGPGRPLKRPPGIASSNYMNIIHLQDTVRGIDFAVDNLLLGTYNLVSDFHPRRRDFYANRCGPDRAAFAEWESTAKISLHSGNKRVSNEKLKKRGFHFLHNDPDCDFPMSE